MMENIQWCELCKRNVERVELLIRKQGSLQLSERIMVCPRCMGELVEAGLAEKGKWAGVACYKLVKFSRPSSCSTTEPYELQLAPAEVHCLRALGFQVTQEGGEKR